MTKSELPEALLILSLRLAEGFIDFQFDDEDRNIAIPAWGDTERAKAWLQDGGLALCKSGNASIERYLSLCHCHAVLRIASCDEYLSLHALDAQRPGSVKRTLHFEPAVGSLLAPQERRVPIA